MATHEGYVTKELVEYYGVLARGGAGLIIVEYSYIQPRGRAVFSQLAVHDNSCIEGLALLAEEIKLHDTKAVLQICHAGRQSTSDVLNGKLPHSPSAIPCEWIGMLTGKTNYCKEMTQDEIEKTIEAFSDAVVRAQFAGYDAVEFHGAVGYLLMSFLSPYTNKRNDFYGGSLENRAKLPIEVVRRSRIKVGDDFPLLYRFSADEFVDGGFSQEEAWQFAQMLEKEGISALHVTGTTYDTIYKHELPMHFPGGNLINLAANIKKHVSIPVIGVGSINDPVDAERYISEGKADMIAMGRALLADPDLPRKAKENRLEEIRPCIRCNEGCITPFFDQSPHRCTVNFSCGRERDFYEIIKSPVSKNVTIIGGGPAGLEAARVASERGHRVILFERDQELGGKLIIASQPVFKKELLRYLKFLRRQIEKSDVEIRLGTTATPELVSETMPDVVIIATGAKALTLEDVGIKCSGALRLEDIFKEEIEVNGNSIAIIGGGYLGCEAGLYFAEKGKKVFIFEKLETIGKDVEILTLANFKELFATYQVNVITKANVMEISPENVIYQKEGKMREVEIDNAVLAFGFRPDIESKKMFSSIARKSYTVGDARSVGKLMQAIHSGFAAGYYS
jgi:2,4-dienoyl-CoA reductase-like NADH-dependent reductase (Old Yellow Enzyme family)/thioredoxin reductase